MKFKPYLAGFGLCLLLTCVAALIHILPLWPFTLANGHHPFEIMIIALLLGMLLNPFISRRAEAFAAGTTFCTKHVLALGIVLLGARLDVSHMMILASSLLLIILVCVALSFILICIIGRLLKMQVTTAKLIAIGTAICGSSAIVAAAPIMEAEKDEIAIAIAAINLLGTVAIFIFPLLGLAMQIPEISFGVWAGASIQAVPQVVAASFAYSHQSGMIGTTVKLVRVLMLAPMIIILSFHKSKQHAASRFSLRQTVPPFILLFFIMMLVKNLGGLSNFTLLSTTISPTTICKYLSSACMAQAMAAIGLDTSLVNVYKNGAKACLLAVIGACLIAGLSLVLVWITM